MLNSQYFRLNGVQQLASRNKSCVDSDTIHTTIKHWEPNLCVRPEQVSGVKCAYSTAWQQASLALHSQLDSLISGGRLAIHATFYTHQPDLACKLRSTQNTLSFDRQEAVHHAVFRSIQQTGWPHSDCKMLSSTRCSVCQIPPFDEHQKCSKSRFSFKAQKAEVGHQSGQFQQPGLCHTKSP